MKIEWSQCHNLGALLFMCGNKKNDAVVEYSRDIGMLVVSICILKIKCNLVDVAVAGLMSYFFFPVKILFCILLALWSATAFF